jgi:hypothetical protein
LASGAAGWSVLRLPTHRSADPGGRLAYPLITLLENRNGLPVDFRVSAANPSAERDAVVEMLEPSPPAAKRRILPPWPKR